MKKGITFIVPVFNTSKTITRCIRSLVRFRNTYVVAVNDGSTDDSQEVLERLATKYDNLRIIKSENEGASSARNKGLEFVETEYVGFCDSDDYYQQLDPLNDLDDSVDLKIFSFEYKGEIKYPDVNLFSKNKLLTPEEYVLLMQPYFYSMFFSAVWNKIYKTGVIREYNIRFDERLKCGEDMVFNLEYIMHINKVAIDTKKICNYYLFKDNKKDVENTIRYYNDIVIRLNKLREICQKMNIKLDYYYNYMSMETIEPVKYILNNYKKKEAIKQFDSLLYNEDTIESLKHYTSDSYRVKLLAKYAPQRKWDSFYYEAMSILIVKGDRYRKVKTPNSVESTKKLTQMREVTDINELHSIELNIMKFIDKLCKDNNLNYYLYAGTLLGAIRHKGFIPWDDDFDICMPRSDYNKLIQIMENNSNEKYSLKSIENSRNKYNYCFAKMIDNNTVVKEIGKFQGEELGVWVDIFPIDGVGNDLKKAKCIIKKSKKYVRQILLLELGRKMNNKGKLLYIIGRKRLNRILRHKLKKNCFYDSDYVADVMTLDYDELIFKGDSFKGDRTTLFEDIDLSIPRDSESILKTMYGDYMELPPEEKRKPAHDCEIWIKE